MAQMVKQLVARRAESFDSRLSRRDDPLRQESHQEEMR
jgi:hypothetical protein